MPLKMPLFMLITVLPIVILVLVVKPHVHDYHDNQIQESRTEYEPKHVHLFYLSDINRKLER